jgi:hypothetical protein
VRDGGEEDMPQMGHVESSDSVLGLAKAAHLASTGGLSGGHQFLGLRWIWWNKMGGLGLWQWCGGLVEACIPDIYLIDENAFV